MQKFSFEHENINEKFQCLLNSPYKHHKIIKQCDLLYPHMASFPLEEKFRNLKKMSFIVGKAKKTIKLSLVSSLFHKANIHTVILLNREWNISGSYLHSKLLGVIGIAKLFISAKETSNHLEK